jgi:dephospho-CoA kinase
MGNLKIIGLAGTNGSGKDTVGHLLADKHGYLFVSVTDIMRGELVRRGLEVTRENLRSLSGEWRRESGLGVLMDKAIAEYEKTEQNYSGVVIASLRNPGEADRIHELGGTVIWVDANPLVRYERVQANKAARGRAGEDDKTFEQFQAEEAAEMHAASDDKTVLNMAGVRDKADISIKNDTSDIEQFRRDIEQSLHL